MLAYWPHPYYVLSARARFSTMDSLTALKLNVAKVLELSVKQNEKLTDIQKKLEHTSASINSLAMRVDRMEESSTSDGRKERTSSRSLKTPKEISVAN